MYLRGNRLNFRANGKNFVKKQAPLVKLCECVVNSKLLDISLSRNAVGITFRDIIITFLPFLVSLLI